mmetsp:Transcript_75000/g.216800  ORF Transcript_75000/g.216800 Transcript_75000/m.216800 type:complete len:248 (+) Transcript_75000:889-1632(+)
MSPSVTAARQASAGAVEARASSLAQNASLHSSSCANLATRTRCPAAPSPAAAAAFSRSASASRRATSVAAFRTSSSPSDPSSGTLSRVQWSVAPAPVGCCGKPAGAGHSKAKRKYSCASVQSSGRLRSAAFASSVAALARPASRSNRTRSAEMSDGSLSMGSHAFSMSKASSNLPRSLRASKCKSTKYTCVRLKVVGPSPLTKSLFTGAFCNMIDAKSRTCCGAPARNCSSNDTTTHSTCLIRFCLE